MPGVIGVLTADDVPPARAAEPDPDQRAALRRRSDPRRRGGDETHAQDAIDAIQLDLEPLPFTVDPLQSLYPGGPNARSDGNVRPSVARLTSRDKWSARDFAAAGDGSCRWASRPRTMAVRRLEAGFADARARARRDLRHRGLSHHCMEPRSALAYWQNGKCFVHGSSQSQAFLVPVHGALHRHQAAGSGLHRRVLRRRLRLEGRRVPEMSIPAHMAKKTSRPVLMRISRAEEYVLGSARPGFQGRSRWASAKTGASRRSTLTSCTRTVPTSASGTSQSRQRDLDRVPARVDALARDLGADQHPAARRRSAVRARTRSRARSSRCSTRPRASSASTGGHPPHQRARQRRQVRRQAGPGDQRLPAARRSTRAARSSTGRRRRS